ncbi:MAG: ATP-dependent 6-phosphofructokinase [Thermodesulfobacteriota bacterium]
MDTAIETLGEPKIDSPLDSAYSVDESERVLYRASAEEICREVSEGREPVSFVKAGPRRKIYFDPSKLKCAMVTCGGLCPGLNNVIRSVVLTLYHTYGVRNVVGIMYGLQGFVPRYGHAVMELNPGTVAQIHELGGTILSTSRGPQDTSEIVDALERMNVGLLFIVGGDGSFRAGLKIADEVKGRGAKIGVVGIPKTIDNDINFLSRSFGFNTAVSMATKAIASAHVEALGSPNGVGLVKLMGRHSGYIAAWASLAQRDANLVLIPESDFDIDGPHGLLAWLEKRLAKRKHAVIVVAEGAGQRYCSEEGTDPSGNVKLGDIGWYLKDRIDDHFKEKGIEMNIKYIDPSYMIRSVPANADDAVFCGFLGQKAVHAGIAGKTSVVVGTWNDEYVLIPIRLVVQGRKQVDLKDRLWTSVLEATGQPSLKPEKEEERGQAVN